MTNLYDNKFLSKEDNAIYKFISNEESGKYFGSCYLAIKDFWIKLREEPELVFKIIKYSSKENLVGLLNLFICNDLYLDILSPPETFPNQLYYLIFKLMSEEIKNIKTISEFEEDFSDSNIFFLLDSLVFQKNIRSYFNYILKDIIENYENSGECNKPIIFNVKEIRTYIKYIEENIQKGLSKTKELRKAAIARRKQHQNSLYDQFYRMKLPKSECEVSVLSDTFSECEEIYNKDTKDNESFIEKYIPDLRKNDLIELLNKEESDTKKNYINDQLKDINNNEDLYANSIFLENVQKSKSSEKILYYYQRSFMTTIKLIDKIIKKFNDNIEYIPDEIKNICHIISEVLKKKFPDISINEIFKFINHFFFIKLFKVFLESPDYNALITSVILSKSTKYNLKEIFGVFRQLISGYFYKNDDKDTCDFTPFNWYFLEISNNLFKFSQILLTFEETDNSQKNLFENPKQNFFEYRDFYSHSIVFNLKQLTTILNVIKHNYNDIMNNENNDISIQEFIKIYEKIKENKLIINKIKEIEKHDKATLFFVQNEIIYSPKIINIMTKNYDNEHFRIKEITKDTTKEEIDKNKIIRAKNLLSDLLFTINKLDSSEILKNQSSNVNTKQILENLNKYYKSISFMQQNKQDKNLFTKIPPEWYINSLMICLENLNENYSQNDYNNFYLSLKNDISNSINSYNFETLTQMVECIPNATLFKNYHLLLQEKYDIISTNYKIRTFIEEEKLEVTIEFIYNDDVKIFNIFKRNEKAKSTDSEELNQKKMNNNFIICNNIKDFILKFPNLSLIHHKQDIEVFVIEKDINMGAGLRKYFAILKEAMENKFTSNTEKKIAYTKIKKYILCKIYDKIYSQIPNKEDLELYQKTILLSWVEPEHLKQKKIYFDNCLPLTKKYFTELNSEKSPSGKFEAIKKIFDTINNVLKFNKVGQFSTDDIAPICEYALIKARPEMLSSNLKFLNLFISEKSSELRKMHFDFLKFCMNNIININYTKFEGVTEQEYEEKCLAARRESSK